ncbi:MAG: class I SAM-dependent rRNA methyltransferase [Anaerolineales bacterium]|nr:class I SAM-dependent rRNA methyltransferase [Anaerolineales bacterium]
MQLTNHAAPVKVQLGRNLVKQIKRGHAWIYGEALRDLPKVREGTPAILVDNRGGKEIARGYLDPEGAIAFRVCTTHFGQALNTQWAQGQFNRAAALRRDLFSPFQQTNAYRLFNGEGDGLPGLVCDVYDRVAILITDGPAAANFWQVDGIAVWLVENLKIQAVFHKQRVGPQRWVEQVAGQEVEQPVHFIENGLKFTADLVEGQKSGFFLDQRNNRRLIQPLAKDKTVLNAFGYTGGFSVYAGIGGARTVTTLDLAEPALKAAEAHWSMNQLPCVRHQTVKQDAFEYLESAGGQNLRWDLVILDPPSFAPSEASVPAAEKAYIRLITFGAQATASGGLLAASSCSSHIRRDHFLEIITTAISQARRMATLIGIHGQPPDHPAPLAMPELNYLKFLLLKLD